MHQLKVRSKSWDYPVLVETGLIGSFAEIISHQLKCAPDESAIFFISDSNTKSIAEKIIGSFSGESRRDRLQRQHLVVKAGEAAKSISTSETLWRSLAELEARRDLILIGIGGGVVGDLTGFIASTWMRGVDLVHVPTTLMAQVDSCLGGKTGVNLSKGKNLVGTFYPPKLVVVDPGVLATLPPEILRDGYSEIIKYGITLSKPLFESLEKMKDLRAVTDDNIAQCLKVKAKVVEEDEFEEGDLRIVLNFGHTIGHAFEAATGFGALSHGQAVALGMMTETKLSEELGILEPGLRERLNALLAKIGLLSPTLKGADKEAAYNALWLDKKGDKSGVCLALPRALGEYQIVKVEFSRLIKLIDEFWKA